jgi:hypothetical protein
MHGKDANGDVQVVGKGGDLLRLPRGVEVLQDEQLVLARPPRRREGVLLRGRDPQPPPSVEAHLHRLHDVRLGGDELDFEAFGNLERLPLVLGLQGVRGGNVVLSEEKGGQ